MDVSRTVLDNVASYLQWRDTQAAANMLNDRLSAVLGHMTGEERQAYEHMVGMIEIAHRSNPLFPQEAQPATEAAPELTGHYRSGHP